MLIDMYLSISRIYKNIALLEDLELNEKLFAQFLNLLVTTNEDPTTNNYTNLENFKPYFNNIIDSTKYESGDKEKMKKIFDHMLRNSPPKLLYSHIYSGIKIKEKGIFYADPNNNNKETKLITCDFKPNDKNQIAFTLEPDLQPALMDKALIILAEEIYQKAHSLNVVTVSLNVDADPYELITMIHELTIKGLNITNINLLLPQLKKKLGDRYNKDIEEALEAYKDATKQNRLETNHGINISNEHFKAITKIIPTLRKNNKLSTIEEEPHAPLKP